MEGSSASTVISRALSTGTGGGHAVRELLRCAEAAAQVYEQLADVRPGLRERAQRVEGFGEGQSGL